MTQPVDRRGRLRFAAFAVAVAVAAVVAAFVVPPDLTGLRDWVASTGAAGPVVAVMAVGVGVISMVPRTIMSIAVGALFGWLPGFACITLGCLLGATVGFVLGRVLGRDFVADRLHRWADPDRTTGVNRWRGMVHRVERGLAVAEGWLVRHGTIGVWIARIIPLSHYGLLSYACGTSGIRYGAFLLGTAIGSVPGALGYTAVGGAVMGPGGLPVALGLALGLNAVGLGVLAVVRRRFGGIPDRDRSGNEAGGGPEPAPAILVADDKG